MSAQFMTSSGGRNGVCACVCVYVSACVGDLTTCGAWWGPHLRPLKLSSLADWVDFPDSTAVFC